MNSKNSFFSVGLFKDALTRTWSVCLAYIIIVLMVLLPMMLNGEQQSHARLLVIIGAGPAGLMTTVLVAYLCAIRCFSHLFVKNGAEFYGSLPISRTAMFITEFLAAYISLVICNVLIGLVLLAVSVPAGVPFGTVGTVFGVCCLYGFVFSALSVLCVMLSGRKGISFLLYLMVNGYAFIVSWGLTEALDMAVFGWSYAALPDVTWASPAAYLGYNITNYLGDAVGSAGLAPEGWFLLAKYAVAAIVVLILSWLLNKNRKLEAAGDALAFSKIRPVITVAFALAAGLGFALFVLSMLNYYSGHGLLLFTLFVIASIVAYVVIESVMARGIGVMKNRVKGTAVVACSSIAIAAVCLVGVQGAMCAVPNANDVKSAQLPDYSLQLDAQEDIQKVVDLQQLIIDEHTNGKGFSDSSNSITFSYTMKDGSVVNRSYEVAYDSNGTFIPEVQKPLVALINSDGAGQWYAQAVDNWIEQNGKTQELSIEYSDKKAVSHSVEIGSSDLDSFASVLKKDILEHGARPYYLPDNDDGSNDYDASVFFNIPSVADNADPVGGISDGYTLSETHTPETVKWARSHYNIEFYLVSEIDYEG